MLKKLLLLSFALIFIANFVNAGPRVSTSTIMKSINAECKIKIVGDAVVGYTVSNKKVFNINLNGSSPQQTDQWTMPVALTLTGGSGIYDMQSNGSAVECIQDPSNANRIHVIYMTSPAGDGTSFPNRRIKYYYSTNKGVTFSFINNTSDVKNGYGCITLAPNGNALIGAHNTNNTGATQMAHYYYDANPGLGSFTELYNTALMSYVWPRAVFTSALTNPTKFVCVQSPNGIDSCFLNTCTSLSPAPGTFTPWSFIYGDQAETYQLARGDDGRIGCVYHVNDVLLPNDYGSVYFMESTNNGVSFGTPYKIYAANVSPTGDSLAAMRGFAITYQGNVPKVVFELIRQTTASSFYPNAANNCIRFWSTSLPGVDPNRSIKIVDTTTIGYWFNVNTSTTTNDVLSCMCRPTIGHSIGGGGNVLFMSFMTPMGKYGPQGNEVYVGGTPDTESFNCVWLTYSSNGGANWVTPQRVTPFDTLHMRDWTYPSISQTNDAAGNVYYANLTAQSDSLPGSYVNFSGNGESVAKQYFIRVGPLTIVGINSISSEVPSGYSLSQNYPNPFNPVTSIRFALPKTSVVTLKVYDMTGKLVNTLVNNETVSVGIKEVKFDATNLSSGVYFYSIKAGDFTDTRKMVVVK